jgi:phosphoribosylaminoimidazolecarboxamide formyltransferase/IMP cyclohydrolase
LFFRGFSLVQVKRALLSVSDKSGLVDFAKGLAELNIEMISTGGTAKALREAGLKVKDISEVTGFPEMLDGRVKTLHPIIHGGLLHLRANPEHVATVEKHGIRPIDMVVVNLYPFQKTVSKPGCTFEEAIENIDIGGPSMIRSGSKNFRSVAVIVNPSRYGPILEEMKAGGGSVADKTLESLVVEAFAHTAEFDRGIHAYLQQALGGGQEFPETLNLHFEKAQDLRYGENPHQKAAFYREAQLGEACVAGARQLWGKELSYNNIADLDAALEGVKEFGEPAAFIIKHANPCGAAVASSVDAAYKLAFDGDPVSAFGGIVALNRSVNLKVVEHIGSTFLECIIAPGFDPEALEALKAKKNLRLMQVDLAYRGAAAAPGMGFEGMAMKKVVGGMLLQERDLKRISRADCKVVTKRAPSEDEWKDLLFGWRVIVHVKSNAILIAKNGATLGVGPGQTNRVGSVKIAAEAAGARAAGASLASDAFFPFRDGLDAAAKAGVKAIIQPGGSVNDKDAIAAADEHGIAMVFTGMRHFYH